MNVYDAVVSKRRSYASAEAEDRPKRQNMYELLCAERPSHWFAPPVVITRASGMEVVLYPDVIVAMVCVDAQKTAEHVSRTDLSDEAVSRLVDLLHGVHLGPGDDESRNTLTMLRYIKSYMDACEQLVHCGVEGEGAFTENATRQLGRDLSQSQIIRDFWDGKTEDVAAVTDAVGFVNGMKMISLLFTAVCPVAVRIHEYIKDYRTTFIPVPNSADLSGPLPEGYVLFDLSGSEEVFDADEQLFSKHPGDETRYLVHGPSIWIRWRYIRRMHAIGGEEVETRRIVMPGDFPRKLFVVLVCTILGVMEPGQAVCTLTPRLVSYMTEHAGEYDLVDGCGEAYPEFVEFIRSLKWYNGEENKKRLLLDTQAVAEYEEKRALAVSSSDA